MARGSLETGGTFVEMTVDVNVTKFPAMEAGFMITRVVVSKGCIMITVSPPNFGADDCGFFFFGQG